jgi:hypothetical protein
LLATWQEPTIAIDEFDRQHEAERDPEIDIDVDLSLDPPKRRELDGIAAGQRAI